jgi:hypothetical protein
LRAVHTSDFPALLDQLGISLLVTTYQAGKFVVLRADQDHVNTHFRKFNKPMGLAVDGDRLAVGTIVDTDGGAAPSRSSASAAAPSPSSSAASVLANDPGTLVAGFVASLSAHSGPVATVPKGKATPAVDAVGRQVRVHALSNGLVGGNEPFVVNLRRASHAALADRYAVDTLFANDDGGTGF